MAQPSPSVNYNEEAFLNELKEEIATHKKTAAIAGFFLFGAFVAVPVSVLIGSKLLAVGAACWIASFFLACSAINAARKMDQAAEKLSAVKLTVVMDGRQKQNIQPNSFFPIGMN